MIKICYSYEAGHKQKPEVFLICLQLDSQENLTFINQLILPFFITTYISNDGV